MHRLLLVTQSTDCSDHDRLLDISIAIMAKISYMTSFLTIALR